MTSFPDVFSFVGARTRHCAYQQEKKRKKKKKRTGQAVYGEITSAIFKVDIYFNTLLEVFHNFTKSYSMAFLSL